MKIFKNKKSGQSKRNHEQHYKILILAETFV